jgi:aminoglycoside 6'-N-acetyltransferase I
MAIEIRILSTHDAELLAKVAPGTFDDPIDFQGARAFLSDSRHHLVVGIDDDLVVGFISAVHYVHPDKHHPEMWINEVQVAPSHRGRGLATSLLNRMLQLAGDLDCTEAWVLTNRDNEAACGLYAGAGGQVAPDGMLMFEFDLRERRGVD